jgi:GWxTD domain-containing protein
MTNATAFTDADAELMGKVIRFITSKEEKELYAQGNLEGKKEFLERFWNRKNPNPGSKINTFKEEIFRRFMYANYYYSSSLVKRDDGWNSDRGRIYITYGPPDQKDRSPSSISQKPYERWTYDRLAGQSGGNICVFIDETGYGNYRLVHSTIRGEISNPGYETMLE